MVIAVIGMLSSVVLVSLGPVRAKARDARRQADMRSISTAMEMCNQDSLCGGSDSKYCTTTAGAGAVTRIGGATTCNSTGGTAYIDPVPQDPSNADDYKYTWIDNTASSSKFCVFTQSEADDAKWIAASHKGTKFDVIKPTAIDCW